MSLPAFMVKVLEAKAGSIVVLETQEPLTGAQMDRLRESVRGRIPSGVFLMLAHRLNAREMREPEQRALMDQLCSSLNMRAVPL